MKCRGTVDYLYQRDGGRCQLCGKRVDRSLSKRHPLAPTIDHIVPVSKGGAHVRANVQLAHRVCNNLKGAGSGGEQLRLVG